MKCCRQVLHWVFCNLDNSTAVFFGQRWTNTQVVFAPCVRVVQGHLGAGDCSSIHRGTGGVHLGQLSSLSQGQHIYSRAHIYRKRSVASLGIRSTERKPSHTQSKDLNPEVTLLITAPCCRACHKIQLSLRVSYLF